MEQTDWDKKRENAQQIDCPDCHKPISVAWFGRMNNVYHCDKCRLLKVVESRGNEAADMPEMQGKDGNS